MLARPPKVLAFAALFLSTGCLGILGDIPSDAVGGRNDVDDDEAFPPSLLEPYRGESHATYDNTFITYDQLRGKVHVIFDDDWVRDGVDEFAEHLAPLGGADFVTRFIEARAATSDFLLTLDSMSKDVCGKAATGATGPFAGRDLDEPLVDVPPSTTLTLQARRNQNQVSNSNPVCGDTGTEATLCTNGTLTTVTSPFTVAERFRVTVRARATASDAQMVIKLNATTVRTVNGVAGSLTDYSVDVDAIPGDLVSASFTNDGSDGSGVDRNMWVATITIVGPLTASTGTTREVAAGATIEQLYRKVLFRAVTPDEKSAAYALVRDLTTLTDDQRGAWSGLCEGLVRSPDFTFTMPPSRATATGTDRDALLLVKLAQDLVHRAPTQDEIDDLAEGRVTIDDQIETFLHSTEFRDTIMHRMRLRTESSGSEGSDEAARLWTYLFTNDGKSYEDLLTGTYNVTPSFQEVSRPDYHGQSGVLTMKGYITGKPGLPHYNYPARVLGDFMGYIFEVPPEVVAMRLGSSASSTVDPNGLCYSCHQLLTPLAHQRQKWTDTGDYRTVDDDGFDIDDSDQNMVEAYPFKGAGMEAFAVQAVRKERFVHHTLNAEFDLLFRRLMRSSEDERVIYKELFDALKEKGDLRAPLRILLKSPTYRGEL